ncbi:MAG: DUF2892 domain-containing protein [Gemmatimonadetes bacterium]|nr:DUF2892 domain-containing protein [Gemmatimonadota bacterium]
METNVGKTDAAVRWIIAVVLFSIAFVFNAHVVWSFFAAVGALVMAGTALTRRCMFYSLIELAMRRRRPVAH